MKLLLVFAALLAVAYAATPHHPSWPSSFSATISFATTRNQRPQFFRWFYDGLTQTDRFDGVIEFGGERWIGIRIAEHKEKTEYDLLSQFGTEMCFKRSLDRPFPRPNFTNFTYVGEAIIDFNPVYHWFYRQFNPQQGQEEVFEYYETKATREPARFDARIVRDGQVDAVVTKYHEFDAGRQDGHLRLIPASVLAQCNDVPQNFAHAPKPMF